VPVAKLCSIVLESDRIAAVGINRSACARRVVPMDHFESVDALGLRAVLPAVATLYPRVWRLSLRLSSPFARSVGLLPAAMTPA
jgi:hypothetical protein